MTRQLSHLLRDQNGAIIVEFALIAPVLMLDRKSVV